MYIYTLFQPCTKTTAFDYQTFHITDLIDVSGFISVSDIGSPMAVSRHLILPASTVGKQETAKADIEIIDDEIIDEGRTPSFCVLLHGALKVIFSFLQFYDKKLINWPTFWYALLFTVNSSFHIVQMGIVLLIFFYLFHFKFLR